MDWRTEGPGGGCSEDMDGSKIRVPELGAISGVLESSDKFRPSIGRGWASLAEFAAIRTATSRTIECWRKNNESVVWNSRARGIEHLERTIEHLKGQTATVVHLQQEHVTVTRQLSRQAREKYRTNWTTGN
ncbi:hypothetical protein LSTR_LSTR015558 [Laodelphax striatellus]|uniref:Uncharacterized protein n=1 Tax=Laodelphax striatellus TaxID=195883 RepID=A0A482WZN9_LAOST|nr:hypothetical protein LSTR_LSTR015558 [Laodelphax striatellus]